MSASGQNCGTLRIDFKAKPRNAPDELPGKTAKNSGWTSRPNRGTLRMDFKAKPRNAPDRLPDQDYGILRIGSRAQLLEAS